MRNILIATALSTLLASCNGLSLQEGKGFFNEAQEKGREVGGETLDKMAQTLDAYCGNVPSGVRSFLRVEVNSRTVNYNASDFCIPKGE